MKVNNWLTVALLGGLLWVGCKDGNEKRSGSEDKEPVVSEVPAPELPDLSWMNGTWMQEEDGGGKSYEIWEQASAENFVGRAFTLVDEDTTFMEKLEIRLFEDTLTYFADVRGNSGPVPFKLLESDSYTATFWNPEYSFPWKIIYTRLADTLKIRVAGFQNKQAMVHDLRMIRQESGSGEGR